jgi:hypothetical protein
LQYVDDVEEVPEGLRVTIRRSKTDQECCSHAAMRGLDLAQRAIAVAAERAVSQRVSVARHEAMKYRRDIDGLSAVAIAARHFRFSPDFGYIAALRRTDVQGPQADKRPARPWPIFALQ